MPDSAKLAEIAWLEKRRDEHRDKTMDDYNNVDISGCKYPVDSVHVNTDPIFNALPPDGGILYIYITMI